MGKKGYPFNQILIVIVLIVSEKQTKIMIADCD